MKKSKAAQDLVKQKIADAMKNIKWVVPQRGTPEDKAQREAFRARYGVRPEDV